MSSRFKIFLFSLFLSIYAGTNALSQTLNTSLNTADTSRNFLEGKENWIEIPEYRQQHRLGYKTPDGRVIFHYSAANLCYYDKEKSLQVVNCDLVETKDGWSSERQQFPSYLSKDGVTSILTGIDTYIRFNQNCGINGKPFGKGNFLLDGNTASVTFPSLPVTKRISFHDNRIETDYIIQHLSPLMKNGLKFSEEMELPSGYTISRDKLKGNELFDGSWQGDLVVYSQEGFEMARLRMPVYFDSNYSYVKGSYQVSVKGNKVNIVLLVPGKWLNDKARVFPVVIDPLLTGPTATWAGGSMPSCLLPTYNTDSILVTVPAQITATALMVQSSYYADPFTNTPKSDGRMNFSTSCGATPTLTVTGPNGQTPGTAYLPWTNYRNPLMCCFPHVCNGYSFYLRMHLARANQGAGCNTTYIYYDQFTPWPFSAYVEGRTIETYGVSWSVTPNIICSDQCTLTLTALARYGVQPYTITHPWASGPVTMGVNNPCAFGNTTLTLTLTIPNCPTYCGIQNNLIVPPPTITDACGNVIAGLINKVVQVRPTPLVTPVPATQTICSGDIYTINYTSCVPGSSITWNSSNQISGAGDVTGVELNPGPGPDSVFYYAIATSPAGCVSPVDTAIVEINPNPIADAGPDVQIEVGQTTTLNATGGTSYVWVPSTGLNCSTCQNPDASPVQTTEYVVFVTQDGCTTTDTVIVDVILPPLFIFVPSAFTPEGNGLNDVFQVSLVGIKEFEIHIFNRWGEELHSWNGLNGSWDGTYKGEKVQQGVYVYYYHADPKDLRYPPVEMTGSFTVIRNGRK
jgi:gliding motility-associated-like protein